MTKYPRVALRKLVRVHYGKALKAEERNETGPYDVYGSNGSVGKHDALLVDHPTIIIGRKGSVGAVTYAPEGGWSIDTTFYVEILDHKLLDLRFLFYALGQAQLDAYTITTSIPGLNRDDIYRTEIPLPPLPKQRRIVAILDKADAIRCKRAEAIRLADDFLKSAFLDLVGPGATSYERWPEKTISALAASHRGAIRTGPFGSNLRHSEFVNGRYHSTRNRQRSQESLRMGTASLHHGREV